jgi:putative peptidoglycan lipid II flippase
MKRGHFSTDHKLNRHLFRLLIAALLMALALVAINPLVDPMMSRTFGWRVAGLTLLVGGGVLVYAVATFATRAFTIGELKALLKRRGR